MCTFEQRWSFNLMKHADSYSLPDYKPLIQAPCFSLSAPPARLSAMMPPSEPSFIREMQTQRSFIQSSMHGFNWTAQGSCRASLVEIQRCQHLPWHISWTAVKLQSDGAEKSHPGLILAAWGKLLSRAAPTLKSGSFIRVTSCLSFKPGLPNPITATRSDFTTPRRKQPMKVFEKWSLCVLTSLQPCCSENTFIRSNTSASCSEQHGREESANQWIWKEQTDHLHNEQMKLQHHHHCSLRGNTNRFWVFVSKRSSAIKTISAASWPF